MAFTSHGYSQTYQVGSGPDAKPENQAAHPQSAEPQLGWGSNIQNARLARAAQLALQQGDRALALNYAQRAAQSAPNDPQLWFLLGYAARLDGRYNQSIDAYKKGLGLNPGSLDGLSGLAQTYSFVGRNDEAERLLKQVIASDPRRKDDLAVLGDLYMRAGDYTNALTWLGKAERMQPDARTELLMALCYQHLGQMPQASRYLELAKRRAPNNPDIERSLAAFYRDTGEYSKAIDELKAIRNPRPDVVAELAYTYGLDGKPEDSARLYSQAANAQPHDLGLQLSAAQAQVGVGSFEHAEEFLKRAAQLDPNFYRLHAIRGEIAQMQDRDSDAVREYSEAVAHLPATPAEGPLYGIQLHMNLEALYRNLNETEQAHAQLQIAQSQIAPMDERGADRAMFLRLRALIRMSAGQLDSALNDMNESLALTPHDPNSLQIDGDLLMKMGRTQDAIAAYRKILTIDPRSRFALTSLGYASRAAGNDRDAEKYFEQLAHDYPSLYVPYLALGDLYTARGEYRKAQASYSKGYAVAPQNALIVAGGMNAAIEAHNLPLAGNWLQRVTDNMDATPQVLREKERYFSFKGDSQQSASIGREAIKVMPRDRDVVVYLGYDLLHLEQYSELLALTKKYMDVFPKDPDIPLLAGYVYKHDGQLQQAVQSFTEALNRAPDTVTAYVNRGFVRNDLHQPELAAEDFNQSLKREPGNGEAHLGLAFAELNLHHPEAAIRQTQLSEKVLGDSEVIHIIRATAYGRQGLLSKSEMEYRAALKFDPKDGSLYMALGNIYFAQRHYHDAVVELQTAKKLLPADASIYALMARAYANLQDREQALENIRLAEEYAGRKSSSPTDTASQRGAISDIYVSTGEALSTLGDQKGAMERFSKALTAPDSNRMGVRLAIAGLMAEQGHSADAERQIALAQMEVEAGDTAAPTGDQYIEAANIFQQIHEYQLSQTYLQRAKAAGASDIGVRVALANSYLALGQTSRASEELAAVSQTENKGSNYQYLLAEAAVYQQQHRGTQALSTFAAAASASGEDQTAEQDMLQAGASEGYRINPTVSILSNLTSQPLFEDSTVYVLDAKTFGRNPAASGPTINTAELPLPRYTIETDWTNAYHLHLGSLPTTGGFFQLRNARGLISVPATAVSGPGGVVTGGIVKRNTTDYTMNYGVDPTVHLGGNVVTFNAGVQGTIRRDSISPQQMNQNLFRVFTYMTTSSFFNAVSMDGFFAREIGPFTELPINERALIGGIDFRVGSPWGKTALVTGWGSNDQVFTSKTLGNTENYYTSTYIGLTHRFGTRLNAEVIAEDLRTWRVVPYVTLPAPGLPAAPPIIHSGISQGLRPAATIDFSPTRNLDIQATSAYERAQGFHVYDMTQNGFAVSYTRPFGRTFNDETGEVHLKYPIRISAGVQEETFPNFAYGRNQVFRPYVSINIF
ncbi:tetratricopeptide repeat protein [Acidipila rosea]|uniref:Tetratricopeptide repeat protein n=2 Tax=Acidipila rosea TaxID=768535 RepID=A0A4V2PV31_9BACT|nr:tetratricopeptide repeat protein [Acidipila rosea]